MRRRSSTAAVVVPVLLCFFGAQSGMGFPPPPPGGVGGGVIDAKPFPVGFPDPSKHLSLKSTGPELTKPVVGIFGVRHVFEGQVFRIHIVAVNWSKYHGPASLKVPLEVDRDFLRHLDPTYRPDRPWPPMADPSELSISALESGSVTLTPDRRRVTINLRAAKDPGWGTRMHSPAIRVLGGDGYHVASGPFVPGPGYITFNPALVGVMVKGGYEILDRMSVEISDSMVLFGNRDVFGAVRTVAGPDGPVEVPELHESDVTQNNHNCTVMAAIKLAAMTYPGKVRSMFELPPSLGMPYVVRFPKSEAYPDGLRIRVRPEDVGMHWGNVMWDFGIDPVGGGLGREVWPRVLEVALWAHPESRSDTTAICSVGGDFINVNMWQQTALRVMGIRSVPVPDFPGALLKGGRLAQSKILLSTMPEDKMPLLWRLAEGRILSPQPGVPCSPFAAEASRCRELMASHAYIIAEFHRVVSPETGSLVALWGRLVEPNGSGQYQGWLLLHSARPEDAHLGCTACFRNSPEYPIVAVGAEEAGAR